MPQSKSTAVSSTQHKPRPVLELEDEDGVVVWPKKLLHGNAATSPGPGHIPSPQSSSSASVRSLSGPLYTGNVFSCSPDIHPQPFFLLPPLPVPSLRVPMDGIFFLIIQVRTILSKVIYLATCSATLCNILQRHSVSFFLHTHHCERSAVHSQQHPSILGTVQHCWNTCVAHFSFASLK